MGWKNGRGGRKDEQKSLLRGASCLSATERAGGGCMTQQFAIGRIPPRKKVCIGSR